MIVEDEVVVSAFAQVVAEDSGTSHVDAILQLNATLVADISIRMPTDLLIATLGTAQVSASIAVTQADALLVLGDASVVVEDDVVLDPTQSVITLVATALVDLGLPVDEETDVVLAFADIKLEDTTDSKHLSAGGAGGGVGPPVRVRPDGNQKVSPTTNRRGSYFQG